MVRYRGLDYLSLVRLKRKEFIARARLSLAETCQPVLSDRSLHRTRHPWASAIPDQALLLGDLEQPDPHIAKLFTSLKSVKHNSLELYGREVSTLSINTSPPVSEGLRTNEDQDEAEDHGDFDELYGDFDLVDFVHTKEEDKDLLYTEEFQTETLCWGTTVTDDLFEDVTLDLGPVKPHVPSLGSQVQGLQPLPLLDPLLNGERECRHEPLELHVVPETSVTSQNQTQEVFTREERFHRENYLENLLLKNRDLVERDSHLTSLGQLSPLPLDEGTEDIKMGTSVKHCCQLEEYVVNQQAGGPPLSSTKDPHVKTWSTDLEICSWPDDYSLETPVIKSSLSADLLTVGELKPLALKRGREFVSLSNSTQHQLLPSDSHFDLCCVERCRFSEPDIDRVELLQMKRLNKEWKEVAVLKWNMWKVELNLCWILHPPTEERLDLNEAVLGYMRNGRQNHKDYQEIFHKEMFELPPLELPGPTVKIKEKVVNNSKPFSALCDSEYQPMHLPPTTKHLAHTVSCITSDNSTVETLYIDLEEEASLSQGESKITEHEGQYQCLIPRPFKLKDGECTSNVCRTLVETQSQRDGSASVLKHQELSISSSPAHRTSPPVSPVPPVLPISPVSLSPDRILSLRSLQDPFLDSLVKTGQNKMQFMKNQHGTPKENPQLQNIQKTDSHQQHRDLNSDNCKPLSDTRSHSPGGGEDTQSKGQMRSQATPRQSQTGSKVNQSQSPPTHDGRCLGLNNVTQTTPFSDIPKVRRGREPGTTPQKSPNKRPSKSRVKCITYQLEDEYQEIISLVTQHASYFITSLVNSGDIDKSMTFTSLTPDLTRFLVKEVTTQPDNAHYEERYRSSLALHTLCCAREMITLVCLESGLELLSVIQEKYRDQLKDCLETLRQRLLSAKLWCDRRGILHPKVYRACQSVHRKLTGKDPERLSHTKILVILSKDLDSLVSTLGHNLQRVDGVKIHIQVTGNCQSVLDNLDHCNCMLLQEEQIGSDFPWSQFCLVLEYEGNRFLELCERQNISYRHFSYSAPTTNGTAISITQFNVTIVCSKAVPENFVHILESKYGVTCLYRSCWAGLTLPHIVIDELTAVVMYDVSAIGTEFSPLLRVLSLLAQQFRDILIIGSTHNFTQPLLKLRQHQQKLNFFLGRAVSKVPDLQFKVVTSDDLQKTAEMVIRVCRLVLTTDDQNWMAASPSQEEEFLTAIPCINPIFAQKMLQILSLQSITDLHPHQLARLFPSTPRRIIQMFYEALAKLRTEQCVQGRKLLEEPVQVSGEINGTSPLPTDRHTLFWDSQEGATQEPLRPEEQLAAPVRTSSCQPRNPPNNVHINTGALLPQEDSDYTTDTLAHSCNSESPNEFVRAQTGFEQEESSYIEELGRVVSRQALDERGDSEENQSPLKQTQGVNTLVHAPLRNHHNMTQLEQNNSVNSEENWCMQDTAIYTAKNNLTSKSTTQEIPNFSTKSFEQIQSFSQRIPTPEDLFTEDIGDIPASHMYQDFQSVECSPNTRVNSYAPEVLYHVGSGSGSGPRKHDPVHLAEEDSGRIHTCTVNNPPVSYIVCDEAQPESVDFQDNLIATTRQLLKQAAMTASDRIFPRTGPRKVSIGLARPLRQPKSQVTPDHEIQDAVIPPSMNSQNQNLNFSGVTAQLTTNPHSAQQTTTAQHKTPLVANPVLEEIPSAELSKEALLSNHRKQGMTQYRESREGGWIHSSNHDLVKRGVGTDQGRWTTDSQLPEPYRHHSLSHCRYTDCNDFMDNVDSDQRVDSKETTQHTEWLPSCRQTYIPSHDSSSTPCQYNIPNTRRNQYISNTQGNQNISNTRGNDSVVESTHAPLRTRQDDVPFHGAQQNCIEGGERVVHNGRQNRTKGGEEERWPGYDSPPMDMEYEFEPIQDLENFQSWKISQGPSQKKLCYQRVPNSKQSKLVFK